jgi:hypothetical protein
VRTTLRWQRLMTATLQPPGLTHVQFVLLATVWWLARARQADGEHAGQPSQREVAGVRRVTGLGHPPEPDAGRFLGATTSPLWHHRYRDQHRS